MKKSLTLLLLLFIFGLSFGQSNQVTKKSFPTNFNQSEFKKIKKFKNKVIAYDGLIVEIKNSKNNTPFYKLDLGNNNYLWTVLMFKNIDNIIGDKIRVVGYLNTLDKENDTEEYLIGYDYFVLALGLVDFNKSNFLFVSAGHKQKEQWVNGEIPNQ